MRSKIPWTLKPRLRSLWFASMTFAASAKPDACVATVRKSSAAASICGPSRVGFGAASLAPALSCGMATLGFDGLEPGELAGQLWKKHKIYVTTIKFEAINGIRVSPNIYTTLSEIDMFCEAVEDVLKHGLPA